MTGRAPNAAEQFNDAHPVGTPVLYWPGARTIEPWDSRKPAHEIPGTESRTSTPAWLMSGVTPCVSVEGYPGGIALTHIEVTEEKETEDGIKS